MEIEIISTECIKPSSPTPQHLKTYELSFFDQFIPSIYVPMVLFYPKTHHSVPNHHLLKQSLSQTLTSYYPLAGKIKDELSIDCNDEGVYYLEARVNNIHLSEFLNQPDMISRIHKFLPCQAGWNQATVGAHVAMIQVNIFGCGGIAIATFITHMVADGIAMSSFLKDWAAATKSGESEFRSLSNGSSLFPQNDAFPPHLTNMAMWAPFFKAAKCVTRRFVFSGPEIAALKEKARSSSVENPTRVEVVSALIWKCITAALKERSGFENPSILAHAVNLRRRSVPPLSQQCMGNYLLWAPAESAISNELDDLVRELRHAITKIDGDFMNKMQSDEGFFNFSEALKEIGGVFSTGEARGKDYLGFSSWCNFGLYEIDFGWGKPVWVTSSAGSGNTAPIFLNFVILMDTRSGDGIEAWVNLNEQDMAIVERNTELLTFASLDPSPLQVSHT